MGLDPRLTRHMAAPILEGVNQPRPEPSAFERFRGCQQAAIAAVGSYDWETSGISDTYAQTSETMTPMSSAQHLARVAFSDAQHIFGLAEQPWRRDNLDATDASFPRTLRSSKGNLLQVARLQDSLKTDVMHQASLWRDNPGTAGANQGAIGITEGIMTWRPEIQGMIDRYRIQPGGCPALRELTEESPPQPLLYAFWDNLATRVYPHDQLGDDTIMNPQLGI